MYSVIMAGGGGTRFWPLSRQDMPKQVLNLSGDDTMINETVKRCEPLIPVENTFIVTNKKHSDLMEQILIDTFLIENILIEPVARNTAPCILYAAMHIMEKHGDGVLCVFPSDHYITNNQKFIEVLSIASNIADETGSVVTLGINPTFPATGYGYIKKHGETIFPQTYLLDRFVEKPTIDKAKSYIESGEYYWNSGIFIWKVSTIINLFKRFLPRIYKSLSQVEGKFTSNESKELLEKIYPNIDSVSVDYGILERLDDAYVIPCDFGWNDVGSWDALGAVFPSDDKGNIIKADHIDYDTKQSIIYGDKKLIATVGLYDIIIVDTEDALLVCSKDKAQDVKFIVEELKKQGRMDLL